MRIALLANVAADLLSREFEPGTAFVPPGFNVWVQEALEPSEGLRTFAPETVALIVDSAMGEVDGALVETCRKSLEEQFPNASVVVPDIAALAGRVADFRDERMLKLASSPYSLNGLKSLADEIRRLASAASGPKKVLALDLDGTLWEGVVGEVGVANIVPRTEFQKQIAALRNEGVLLVAISKNNEADVAPAWDDPRMVLGRSDFAAVRINWKAKSDNLRELAAELNLGTDSFVFIDDRAVERERMRAALPEVVTPDWPVDFPAAVRMYFRTASTDEDRRRGEMYAAADERRRFSEGLTKEAYLGGLQTVLDIHPARPEEAGRIAQLSERTHQFNVSGNRYSADEVGAMVSDPERILLAAHLKDRFGDEGLIAYVNCISAEIVDFAMSCRVADRGVERAVFAALRKEAVKRGWGNFRASVRKTPKNIPVQGLFESVGLEKTEENEFVKWYNGIFKEGN